MTALVLACWLLSSGVDACTSPLPRWIAGEIIGDRGRIVPLPVPALKPTAEPRRQAIECNGCRYA